MRFDVVIVGAGIGGAVLALDLGRRGWRVALVERERTPLVIARPEILWSPTMRALHRYGVADAIRERACVKLEMIEIGGRNVWLRITSDDFAAAGVEAFSTNPSMTRSILSDAAVGTGNVEIHRGITVEKLVRDNGSPSPNPLPRLRGRGQGEGDFLARLVVGDDGGNSIVRTQLGIPIALTPFPIDFLTAMVPQWTLAPNRARVWLDEAPAHAFIPWPGGTGVEVIPWRADLPTPPAFANFKRVARPFGHATTYVADGAALIGDAIHPMTPAGGQGANASIWDALALADVAHAALQANDVSRERLLPFERLRRPINERSVAISHAARRVFRAGRFLPLSVIVPLAMRTINALGWPKRRVLQVFSSTFVHPQPVSADLRVPSLNA